MPQRFRKTLTLTWLATLMILPGAASAQHIDNQVTETARGIAIRSANGGYGPADNSPARMAEKRRVNALVANFGMCRRNASDAGNKRSKDIAREQCRRNYQPQFARACVGGAQTIAICMKLKRTGSIA